MSVPVFVGVLHRLDGQHWQVGRWTVTALGDPELGEGRVLLRLPTGGLFGIDLRDACDLSAALLAAVDASKGVAR